MNLSFVCEIVLVTFFASKIVYLSAECDCDEEDVELGQQQLVDILDAAWVRVLFNGYYFDLIKDVNGLLNQADCLPVPEITPFPLINDLKCLSKRIIDTEFLRVGIVPSGFNPTPFPLPGADPGFDTTTTLLQNDEVEAILKLIIEQINLEYSVNISRETIEFAPFGVDLTAALNNNDIDILDQVNALGGRTADDNRRRVKRLFTCSMLASGQFLIVNNDNTAINSSEDAFSIDRQGGAGGGLNLCGGVLSTQTAAAYFPNSYVDTFFRINGGDINTCMIGVADNTYDAFVTVFPTIQDTEFDFIDNGLNENDFKIFDLKIVTATPYWIGKDVTNQVICPDSDDSSSSSS